MTRWGQFQKNCILIKKRRLQKADAEEVLQSYNQVTKVESQASLELLGPSLKSYTSSLKEVSSPSPKSSLKSIHDPSHVTSVLYIHVKRRIRRNKTAYWHLFCDIWRSCTS